MPVPPAQDPSAQDADALDAPLQDATRQDAAVSDRTRPARDTALGVWLALVGAGFFAWLALDLAQDAVDSVFAVVARAACGAFWWSLAAVVLSRRWHRLGLLAAAGSVGVLLGALGLGLLVTPAQFVTGSVPATATQARLLGAAVLAVAVGGGLWWARRSARRGGQGVEDGPHGG